MANMIPSTSAFGDFERAGWEDAATASTYDEHFARVTGQSAAALLEDAGVRSGLRVLDVACGGGQLAAAAAQRGADVVGVDFSATQVGLARSRHPGLRFEQADAAALPFEAHTFDAVACAFGLCHFPEPDLALREAHRVLRHGGRIAFSVWDDPEHTIGFAAVYAAIRRHGTLEVGLPVGPNFWLYSDAAQAREALRDAGFASPTVRTVPQVWRLADADQLFQLVLQGTVRAAALLRAQSPAAREAIRRTLREVAETYRSGNRYELPMPALIATAVKA
jgi:ubiquinone/menaquinone biosynthesis C-methylase UbiE